MRKVGSLLIVAGLAAQFMMSPASFAAPNAETNDQEAAGKPPQELEGPLHLTKDQREKMKTANFKHEEKMINLKADLDKSRLEFEKEMASPKADYDSSKSAAADVRKKETDILTEQQNFRLMVAFKILKPEQREAFRHHAWMWHRFHGPEFRGPEAERDNSLLGVG